jgi:tetratricopeptide (TPR) repeat protein
MPRIAAGLLVLALVLSAETPLETARRLKQEGSPAAALTAYETALPSLRAAGDRAQLAQALLEAAQSALAAGDYNRTFDRASEAVVLFHQRNDDAGEAGALNTAASAQLYRGQYTAALDLFHNALAIDRRRHDAKGEVSRLGNIGNAFFFQGRYLDALDNYQAALRRLDQNASEPWAAGRRQIGLTNLAILYEQLGQNQRALDYYRLALATGGAISPSERGQVLSNLGTLYRRMGDAVKALEAYAEAQKLFAQEHVSDAEIHVLQNAGIALALDFGNTAAADRSLAEALRLAEGTGNRREIVLAHLFRGESLFRADDHAAAARDFADALAGAREIGASEEQWTALYGVARVARRQGDRNLALARLRDAIAIIESVRSSLANPSLKSDFLADKRDVYDAAIGILLESPQRDAAQLFHWFEQARARNLRDAMRGPTAPPTLSGVQQRLAEGSGLAEYWIGDGRLAALWVTHTASGVIDRAWTREDDAAVSTFVAGLQNAKDDSWRGGAVPLLPEIPWERMRRVAIVPDGVLYRLPFEVLPVSAAGQLLIERMPVSYLPSASLLFRDQALRTSLAPWRRQLIAFGDPAGSLPEAGRELRSIGHVLPGRASLHAGADDLKRHLQGNTLADVPLLHFATHAIVDLSDSNRSRVQFTPERGSPGSEYLFRGEVQSLPLEGTDLVTLSACDTEAGRVSRGEGIQSFSRAFLAAGARATVTTLWRVEDRATAEFMRVFYENLGQGRSKADSLRAAKLSFVQRGGAYALPQTWAAFVLNGEGDSPIRPVLSWLRVFAVTGIAAAAILFYLRRRRG